jgi:uncharacterized membrane protein YfcA
MVVVLLSVGVAFGACLSWMREKNSWMQLLPWMMWLVNAGAFVATGLIAETYPIRIGLNVWGLLVILHGTLTLLIVHKLHA